MKKIDPAYIYSFLVFIGFYNYYIYYSYFDIEIISFLSLSELLLSFLSITFPIILFFALIIFAFYPFVIFSVITSRDSKNIKTEKNEVFSKIKSRWQELKNIIKKKKWKSFMTYLSLFHIIASLVKNFLILLFVFIYPFFLALILERPSMNKLLSTTIITISLMWLFIFELQIIQNSKLNEVGRKGVRLILIIFLSLILITIYNRDKAEKLLNGKAISNVEFEYKGKPIKTNPSIIFIGMTEKYMFLRDLKLDENQIFLRNEIKLLKIKKIK